VRGRVAVKQTLFTGPALSSVVQSIKENAGRRVHIPDHPTEKLSDGIWGNKTFVFVDTLDIKNRLFAQLSDAEGWRFAGNRTHPKQEGPLAQLRNPYATETGSRALKQYGQDWEVAMRIGVKR
jgi:hypothetical protein